MDKLDSTISEMNEQRELANEIAETLGNPLNAGMDLDEVRLSLHFFGFVFLTIHVQYLPVLSLFKRMSENILPFLPYLTIQPLRRHTTGRAESRTRRATARRAE